MNIVHVVRQFHPGIGGIENYVEQLATRQAARGNLVRVATLDRIFDDPDKQALPRRELWRGLEIVRLPFTGSRRYPVAPSVLRALEGADLIHVHGVDFFADFLALTRVGHRKPIVLTTHGGFFHTSFARRLKQVYLSTMTRATISQCAAVIACSEEDERRFRPVAGPRLRLIANPVDIDKFEGLANPRSATIIYFGRLAPNKQVKALIEWFAGLAQIDPDARLIVAGKPMGVDPTELRNQAESAGLKDRFELHDTPSDDQLRELIRRSGTYACASSYEGFGLAAVEAASAGLFPVLSEIPPFAATLARLGWGQLVDFHDRASWPLSYRRFAEEKVRFASDYDPHRIRAGVSPFDWDAAIDRFDTLYREVLGEHERMIGALRIEVTSSEAAIARILAAVDAGEKLLVTFGNAHSANLARKDDRFAAILRDFLVLNDGIGVDLASKALFGSKFPDNLNGTDFTPALLAAAKGPLPVYLIGSAPGVAEAAATAIMKRLPHVRVAGLHHGFFENEDEAGIARDIRASGARLVLAAMGQPRQEQWAKRNIDDLDCPVLCVGALLDFLAERVPRAPGPIRRLRLEWAYRLVQEPRRLAGRYLVGNATFLGAVMRQKFFGGRS